MYKSEAETTEESISFRLPMQIREVLIRYGTGEDFNSIYSYPICPRCDFILEFDYQSYCDNCGQSLKWTYYSRAKLRYIDQEKRASED